MCVTVLSRCLARCGLRSAVCGLRSAVCGSGCAVPVVRARGWRPSSRVPSAPPSDPRPTQRRFASRRVARRPGTYACACIYFTFSHFISQRAQGRARATRVGYQSPKRAVGGRTARVPGRTRLAQNGRCALGADLPPPPPPPPSPSLSCQTFCRAGRRPRCCPWCPRAGYRSIGRMNTTRLAWRGLAEVCSARRRENTWLNRLWAGWP